jgi:hypothetical protein
MRIPLEVCVTDLQVVRFYTETDSKWPDRYAISSHLGAQ